MGNIYSAAVTIFLSLSLCVALLVTIRYPVFILRRAVSCRVVSFRLESSAERNSMTKQPRVSLSHGVNCASK